MGGVHQGFLGLRMSSMNSRDTKLYPVCDPYSGEVGAAWERIFEPAFL